MCLLLSAVDSIIHSFIHLNHQTVMSDSAFCLEVAPPKVGGCCFEYEEWAGEERCHSERGKESVTKKWDEQVKIQMEEACF